jgi:hypothetical protein
MVHFYGSQGLTSDELAAESCGLTPLAGGSSKHGKRTRIGMN